MSVNLRRCDMQMNDDRMAKGWELYIELGPISFCIYAGKR